MHTHEPVCPQCSSPLRRVTASRLDCARCGASVLLDGAPSGRAGPLVAGGLLGALLLGAGLLVVGSLGMTAATLTSRCGPGDVELHAGGAPQIVVPGPARDVAMPVGMPQPEPDFLEDPEAMAALPSRIHEAVGPAFTGRFKFLSVDRNPVAVALVEVGPGAVDSVVFSWGHQVHATVPMNGEELGRLSTELIEVGADQLGRIPALVDRVEAEGPEGVRVEGMTILAIGGPPRIQLTLSHPRIELATREFTLDGEAILP